MPEQKQSYDDTFIPQEEFKMPRDTYGLYKLKISNHAEAIKYLSEKHGVDASKVVIPFFIKALTLARGFTKVVIHSFFIIRPSKARIKKAKQMYWAWREQVIRYKFPDYTGRVVRGQKAKPPRRKKMRIFWRVTPEHIELLKEKGLIERKKKYTKRQLWSLLTKNKL